MEERVNKVTVFSSYVDVAHGLSTYEEKGRFLEGILDYAFYGIEPDFADHPVISAVFTAIRPNIDASVKRSIASASNSAKGGRPKSDKPTDKPNKKPKQKPIGLTNPETERLQEKDNEKEREGYYPNSNNPSLSAEPCAAVADKTAPQSQLRCPKCNDPVIDDGTGGWYCQRCRKTTKVAVPSLPNGTPPPANVLAMVEGMR